jgi:hypothetical protein
MKFKFRTWVNRKTHLSKEGERESLCGKAIDYDIECTMTVEEFSKERGHCKKCESVAEKLREGELLARGKDNDGTSVASHTFTD